MDDFTAILWLAVEDYSGLWEAVWELRTRNPEVDSDVLTDRARRAVGELIDRGLAQLYYCQEPYGEMTLIDNAPADEVLNAAENWLAPDSHAISVRFCATQAGDAMVTKPGHG